MPGAGVGGPVPTAFGVCPALLTMLGGWFLGDPSLFVALLPPGPWFFPFWLFGPPTGPTGPLFWSFGPFMLGEGVGGGIIFCPILLGPGLNDCPEPGGPCPTGVPPMLNVEGSEGPPGDAMLFGPPCCGIIPPLAVIRY